MRAGFLFGSPTDEFSVPRAVPAWWWAFWVRLKREDHVKGHVQSKDLVHIDMPPFWGPGMIHHKKAVGPELASCLMSCIGWSLQATTAAGGHSAGGICLVATVSQLDCEWRPGPVDSREVHFCSPRTSSGCGTEAVVTAVPNLRPCRSWMTARAWVLLSQIFLNEFSGLLNSELLKTKIFLIWGLSTKLTNSTSFWGLNLVSRRGLGKRSHFLYWIISWQA